MLYSPIPGRDFFNDNTLRPAPVLAIYPDGSLCHQSYEINRPDLPLCIGFDHAIHLVLLILTRTNSFAMHLSTRICCRTPDSRINYDRIFYLFIFFLFRKFTQDKWDWQDSWVLRKVKVSKGFGERFRSRDASSIPHSSDGLSQVLGLKWTAIAPLLHDVKSCDKKRLKINSHASDHA